MRQRGAVPWSRRCAAGVLDLSQRADIPAVASRLAGVQVRL